MQGFRYSCPAQVCRARLLKTLSKLGFAQVLMVRLNAGDHHDQLPGYQQARPQRSSFDCNKFAALTTSPDTPHALNCYVGPAKCLFPIASVGATETSHCLPTITIAPTSLLSQSTLVSQVAEELLNLSSKRTTWTRLLTVEKGTPSLYSAPEAPLSRPNQATAPHYALESRIEYHWAQLYTVAIDGSNVCSVRYRVPRHRFLSYY